SCDPAISPALWIDGLRLRQILGNFVSNALKFTRQGGVEIRAELLAREHRDGHDHERVRIFVRDTGIGMTPEQQQRVFDPFVQADQDHASRSGGTGLGLTICARLAERMGAELTMQSEPGSGTTMSLEVSLAMADPSTLGPDAASAASRDLERLRELDRYAPSVEEAEASGQLVLVVDDHPINRMVLQSQLNHL